MTVKQTMTVRLFRETDAPAVSDLFIRVNRLIAPSKQRQAFENYIALSLKEEINCIGAYYAEHNGAFFVAEDDGKLAGMFGLEEMSKEVMELRRMYVEPSSRRRALQG
jgi:putative acetyltransferase